MLNVRIPVFYHMFQNSWNSQVHHEHKTCYTSACYLSDNNLPVGESVWASVRDALLSITVGIQKKKKEQEIQM